MYRSGWARPGALQMLIAAFLMLAAGIEPLYLAAISASHEWSLAVSGMRALLLGLAYVALVVLYVVGFVRYGASKGYSRWLGFFLSLGNLFGLVVLLLLPDLAGRKSPRQTEHARHEAAGSKIIG